MYRTVQRHVCVFLTVVVLVNERLNWSKYGYSNYIYRGNTRIRYSSPRLYSSNSQSNRTLSTFLSTLKTQT